MQRIFVLVMAAGAAERFGQPKQLATYRGEALIRRAVTIAEQVAGPRSVVVLGNAWRQGLAACSPLAGYFVLNQSFAQGLASSVAAGVAAVEPTADAVLITFCDQPLIDAEDLARLIDAWDGDRKRIVRSVSGEYRGPPTLFPARYFEELKRLRGDSGGRSLLTKYCENVLDVECRGAGVDVDTPEDLAALAGTRETD